jgi:hypothetical protein
MIFRRPAPPPESPSPGAGNVVQRAQHKLQELDRRYNSATFTLNGQEEFMSAFLCIVGLLCIFVPPSALIHAWSALRWTSLLILAVLTLVLLALFVSHYCLCFWGQVVLKRDHRFAGVAPHAPLKERVKAFWERPELQRSTSYYYEAREATLKPDPFYFADVSVISAKMPQIWKEMLAESDRYGALPEDEQVRALVLRTVFLEVSAKEKAA